MTQSRIQRYAIWLMPAQPDREELQTQIETLSQRFSAVPFLPHLTLFAGADKPLAVLQSTVEAVCAEGALLTLMSTGLNVTPAFFQTLFVEFAPHPGLAALAERLQRELAPDSARPFHPHLSLLYHDLPWGEKESLRAEIVWDARPIRFDEISIVLPPVGELGWEDIAAWKTMATHKLR
jgi:2'-5' RNA ligase